MQNKNDEFLRVIFLIARETGETPQEIIKKVCQIENIPQESIKIIPRV